MEAPWVSVALAATIDSTTPRWPARPCTIAATSEEEQVFSCEYRHTLRRSTCQ
jgi:hypothetical protein